jgi:hypothetical protein
MQRLWVALALGLAVLAIMAPSAAQAAQAVTIDSNLVVRLRHAPPFQLAARASVILLAGGNGVLNLNGAGDTRDLQGNFLIRSARLFLGQRLNVAMLDAEPAFPAPAGLNNQRLTVTHAVFLGRVVAAVRRRWPGKPVWLVGTSNGTLSAMNAAARLRGVAGVRRRLVSDVFTPRANVADGLVLTSPITQPGTEETGTVLGANPSLADIGIPTLVMWNEHDQCSASPAPAFAVFNGLSGVPTGKKAISIMIEDRPNVAVHACSAFGPHGYNGEEQQAVREIAKFILMHSPP